MDNSSYLTLIEKVALECKYHMRNGNITAEQYDGAMTEAVPFLWPTPPNQKVTSQSGYSTFFGIPVVPTRTGYTLFVRCEYCGIKQFPETKDGLAVCAKCGAPVE